jgi:D-alanyl-D-alanine carboxypeptidase (penicillin-binding protein 5/6)
MGNQDSVPLLIEKDLVLTLNRKARKNMKVKVIMQSPISAPIKKGSILAKLKIEFPNQDNFELPLISGVSVGQLGLFSRLGKAVEYLLWGEAG